MEYEKRLHNTRGIGEGGRKTLEEMKVFAKNEDGLARHGG
jgi:hypothetical protein